MAIRWKNIKSPCYLIEKDNVDLFNHFVVANGISLEIEV